MSAAITDAEQVVAGSLIACVERAAVSDVRECGALSSGRFSHGAVASPPTLRDAIRDILGFVQRQWLAMC